MTTILIAAIGFVVGVLTGAIAVVAFAGWARTPVAHEYPVEIFALSEEDGCGFLAVAPVAWLTAGRSGRQLPICTMPWLSG
jgi:hypothetical protein